MSPLNVATFAEKVDAAQVLFAVNSDLAASTLSASVATYLADERSPSAWLNRPNGRAAPTKPTPKHPALPPRLPHPHHSLLLPLSTNNSQLSLISQLAARCSPLFRLIPTATIDRYSKHRLILPGRGAQALVGRTAVQPTHTATHILIPPTFPAPPNSPPSAAICGSALPVFGGKPYKALRRPHRSAFTPSPLTTIIHQLSHPLPSIPQLATLPTIRRIPTTDRLILSPCSS